MACRWGVTRRPWSRNRSVSSSTVIRTIPGYRQSLSTANRGGREVPGGEGRTGGVGRARAYASAPMGLLVANVIRHGAAVVPNRLAATMAEDELTFGELEERTNQ